MKINEVSKMYDITADTLRYYERIGLIPTVNRNESGIRDYTETDCNWVNFAKCMRAAGISVESLIEICGAVSAGRQNKGGTQGNFNRGACQAARAHGADAGNAR